MNVIEEVKKLRLPAGQYVVVGSASLAMRGIRPCRNISIAVLPALFSELRSDGTWQMIETHGSVHLVRGIYEILSDVHMRGYATEVIELIRSAEVIEGVPCIDLLELKRFKMERRLPRDVADASLISDYLLHHSK